MVKSLSLWEVVRKKHSFNPQKLQTTQLKLLNKIADCPLNINGGE